VLCTSGGVHGAAVLERLRSCGAIEIAGVILSTCVWRKECSFLQGAFRHWRRSGLPYTLYLGLSSLGRLQAPAMLRTRNIDSPESLAFLRRLAPDLLVSAWFNQRIGDEAAAIPRLGAVNIHPSPLPAYRGVDPVFYARLRGETRLGVSLHRVSAEWDRGNVLAQQSFPVDPTESIRRATTRLFARGADLLIDSLGRIAAGDPGTPQPDAGSYDSWPDRIQVSRLRQNGVRLF
jgi:methionyl-tRNA formyltransferase